MKQREIKEGRERWLRERESLPDKVTGKITKRITLNTKDDGILTSGDEAASWLSKKTRIPFKIPKKNYGWRSLGKVGAASEVRHIDPKDWKPS